MDNDCSALSLVARPPAIFWVPSATGSRAFVTSIGLTPARSSRVANTSWVRLRSIVSMAVKEETLEAWYSARPESTRASVRMRNPSRRLASTSAVSESITWSCARTRTARNTGWLSGVTARSSSTVTRSPRPWVVPSTTAMFFTPPPRSISVGRKMIAPKNTGPSRAITQNHFLRTRSTNSRRITAHTLRTGLVQLRLGRGGHGLRSHEVDEDLVERGLGELEARQSRARGDEDPEDLLRVRLRRQLELRELSRNVLLRDQTPIRENPVGVASGAIKVDQ